MPHLELEQIFRSYSGEVSTTALRGVTLTIERGEFVAIEGPSGGGKSTMLNIIGLLDEPTSGTYRVDGIEIATVSNRQLAELRSDRFSFIFQSFHLLDRRPVLDSVELALVYRAVDRSERRRLAMRALEEVGLAHLAWQLASKLSGGERQRVAIARALATGASVVVADEPTGNLDSENSAVVVESLRALNRAGSTVILVTHSSEVAAAAQRRVRIRDGRIEAGDRTTDANYQPPSAPLSTPPGRASRLTPPDLLRDAFASVASRIGRTVGLVAAVAVGVALAIATIGVSVSANAQVADTFNAHTNRDVSISWTPDAMSAVPQDEQQPAGIVKRLGALNGVDSVGLVSDYGQHSAQASPIGPTFQINDYTMTPDTPAAARQSIEWTRGHAPILATGEVVIGSSLAAQLELGPIVASPTILLDNRIVTVVGILNTSPRLPELLGAVVSSVQDAGQLGYEGRTQALILTTVGASQMIARQAPWIINPYEPKSLGVKTPVDPTTLRAQVEAEVQATLFALTGVAFLASIAGLANAMVLSVIERRQEFGLRRALGARPLHIANLVLVESTIIGAIGGLVGLLFGLGATLIVTILRQWGPVFDLSLAPAAIGCGILVGAIGGLLASVRASRIQPNAALRL
jgi:macrolide transport system ATP-binding/permease protein